MKLIFLRDQALKSRLDTLTYAELRDMLPRANNDHLPSPRVLLDELRGRFLEIADVDFKLRIYANGMYLYREADVSTVFWVSKCSRIAFPSLQDGLHVTDMMNCVWFLPLKIAGEYRVDHNRDSRESYRNVYHFESDIPIPNPLMPCTPDFVQDADPEAEERYWQARKAAMLSAWNALTARQKQLLRLYRQDGMTMEKIAEKLGICKSTASKTIQRAGSRLDASF